MENITKTHIREELRLTRFQNLECLIYFFGEAMVWDTLDLSPQRKWQLKNRSGCFGDKLARKIEKRFSLKLGWMDFVHENGLTEDDTAMDDDYFCNEIMKLNKQLSERRGKHNNDKIRLAMIKILSESLSV